MTARHALGHAKDEGAWRFDVNFKAYEFESNGTSLEIMYVGLM